MSQGWVSIHRQIFDDNFYYKEKFCQMGAWVDMLLLANHKDSSFLVRGNEVIVKRGQIARSERTFCERWRWSRNKLRLFLKRLESRGQIVQQKNRVMSVIIIVNYNKYQEEVQQKVQQRVQQKVQQKDQYNNVNKSKSRKNKKFITPEYLNEILKNPEKVMEIEAELKIGILEVKRYIEKLRDHISSKGGKYYCIPSTIRSWRRRAGENKSKADINHSSNKGVVL